MNKHRMATFLLLSGLILCSQQYPTKNIINTNNTISDIKKEEVATVSDTTKVEEKQVAETSSKVQEDPKVSIDNSKTSTTLSRGSSTVTPEPKKGRKVEFILSFYTSLAEENGNQTLTASGKKLSNEMVASNVYKLGTKIDLGKYGTVSVEDRGGNHFNSPNRLDVFVPRIRKSNGRWESDAEYKRRVLNLGRVKIVGYVMN